MLVKCQVDLRRLVCCDYNYFPNIHTHLVSGASVVRRQTTYLKSTMCQEQLNGLVMTHFHYDIVIDHDAVLDMFARKHP